MNKTEDHELEPSFNNDQIQSGTVPNENIGHSHRGEEDDFTLEEKKRSNTLKSITSDSEKISNL